MTKNSATDEFNIRLRERIFNAITEAHRVPGQRPIVVNNSVAISALLDAVALYAGTYDSENYTPEDLAKMYMDDLPKRIRRSRKLHQKNDTDIIRRREMN